MKYYLIMLILLSRIFAFDAAARENSTALYNEAAKLAKNGEIDKAIEIFKRVVEISPYYSLGHYGLGKAYLYKKDKIDDAIKHLKKAVYLDRRLARGYFYLGMALMFDKQYVHSLHAFDNAFKNDNEMLEALYNMAVIYEIMNKRQKSGKYFEWYIYLKEKKDLDILF